jgi:hypothetical protein
VLLILVCLGVAGVMFGGAWSLHTQGQPRSRVVLVAVIGLLALAAGVLRLVPAMRA